MSSEHHAHERRSGDGDAAHEEAHGNSPLSHQAKRVMAIKELLVEKGAITEQDVQRFVDAMGARSPADGARVVARAWTDPDFRRRLLAGPRDAVGELGYALPDETELAVIENTDLVHHLVVCTLCSCYPTALLGPPPDWYKSLAYRARAVVDPRGVMREFGLELDDAVEVRVVDSTADLRYLVLPLEPAGTEGMSEEELATLVNRDSMIGVARPLSPESAAAGSSSH